LPNSRKVFTSGYDGAVGLFDLDSGNVRLLGYHNHLVNRVIVSPAATKMASSSSDYTIFIWDLRTFQVERVLKGHSDDVDDFVFIDERLGASVSQDCRIIIWDLTTGAILRVLEGHEKDVISIASYDGRLYTCGDDKTLRVWNIATGKLVTMWGPFDTETDTCAIDPLHHRAVLGCDDGYLRLFDIMSGTATGEVKAHASGIKKVAVSPVNGDILSAAYDQRGCVWDAVNLHKRVELDRRLAMWERSVCWSPDGKEVLAGTFDGTVLAWDAGSGKCLTEAGEATIGNVCFNDASATPDGEVALVSDDGRVRLARINESVAEWRAVVEPASGRVLMNAVTFDKPSNTVICGTHDQHLLFFDKVGDRLVNERRVYLGEGPVNCIRVAHHAGFENLAYVANYHGTIVCVSLDGKIVKKLHHHEAAVKALRLHTTRPLGVSCSSDGFVASWDLEGRFLKPFVGHMAIADDLDFNPSGTCVASVSRDFTLKVFELDTGRLCHSVPLGRRSPKAVCFIRDDMIIASSYWGEVIQVRLPDMKVARKAIARNGISSLNAIGRHVLAASYDGSVCLIRPDDLGVERCLRAMTQRVDGKDWD
jgi:WD40 repeat protein